MPNRAQYSKTPQMHEVREKIKKTARTMILSHGIARTTMKDIALNCDIGRKTLYRYFMNIDEIAQAIFIDLIQSPSNFQATYICQGVNGKEKLAHAIRANCRYWLQHPEILLFFYEYDYHFRQPDKDAVHQTIKARPNLFAELLEEGLHDGSIDLEPERVFAVSLNISGAIIANAQRVLNREKVYEYEYGFVREDLMELAELLIAGIKRRTT